MIIKINGQVADIVLDLEKTVGEVLAALEQWLVNSGHRLSGLAIDNENVNADALETAFLRDVETVKNLDIFTSSLSELSAQSLVQIYRDIDEYESLDFDEKQNFFENWNESPQAKHIAEQFPDIFTMCSRAFSGEINFGILRSVVEERLRELGNPAGELPILEQLVSEVCTRLEELPLDVQTGKDMRAAETIQIFSTVAEKVFRIFDIFNRQGFSTDTIKVGEAAIPDYISEFSSVIKEMLAAYEQQDTVLVGDLAEYELAPRLRGLTTALSQAVGEKTWAVQV